MVLTVVLLILASVFFWAGFRSPRRTFQHHSQTGFVVCLALAGFAGYFAIREKRAVGELAALIDPVPEITDVTYVPTSAEGLALSNFLAAVPRTTRIGTTQDERRSLAEDMRERQTEYWLLETALAVDSVFAFYRKAATRRGWKVTSDEAPWLLLSRGDDSLFLFVTDDFPRPGVKVLYGFTPG
jgi:hypothetical protein